MMTEYIGKNHKNRCRIIDSRKEGKSVVYKCKLTRAVSPKENGLEFEINKGKFEEEWKRYEKKDI